jgi:BirA family biotin operon repressor/biotin-[acetyl-CoA-carboxylase] ligase
MNTRAEILHLLADGELHSGADLGRRLGVSRAAVCKGVKALGATGLAVHALTGRGYRLEAPLTPLDRRRIVRHLDGSGVAVRRIEILEHVHSTNRHLLAQAMVAPDPSGSVCLAEVQSLGRGRHGRHWIATPYQNLMLSIAWRFASGPAMVSGLSLAAGVAVVRALERYGVHDAGLKWPNDVLWEHRKLAGLLVDVHGEASGPCTVVLGVGINCRIAPADARHIDQPWVDLYTITGAVPDRNRLAAFVIHELQEMFRTFAHRGLAVYRAEWERRHLYTGRQARVWQGAKSFDGAIEGIDENGALRIRDVRNDIRIFHSGEISLRALR